MTAITTLATFEGCHVCSSRERVGRFVRRPQDPASLAPCYAWLCKNCFSMADRALVLLDLVDTPYELAVVKGAITIFWGGGIVVSISLVFSEYYASIYMPDPGDPKRRLGGRFPIAEYFDRYKGPLPKLQGIEQFRQAVRAMP